MVLWYFHVKYAALNHDPGWKLPSFYENCPDFLGGSKFPAKKGILEPDVMEHEEVEPEVMAPDHDMNMDEWEDPEIKPAGAGWN